MMMVIDVRRLATSMRHSPYLVVSPLGDPLREGCGKMLGRMTSKYASVRVCELELRKMVTQVTTHTHTHTRTHTHAHTCRKGKKEMGAGTWPSSTRHSSTPRA